MMQNKGKWNGGWAGGDSKKSLDTRSNRDSAIEVKAKTMNSVGVDVLRSRESSSTVVNQRDFPKLQLTLQTGQGCHCVMRELILGVTTLLKKVPSIP